MKGLRLVRSSENRAHQREGRSRKGRQRRKTAKRVANRKKKKISKKIQRGWLLLVKINKANTTGA